MSTDTKHAAASNRLRFIATVLSLLLSVVGTSVTAQAAWQPQKSSLTTRWAAEVTPKTAHLEYPRPQLVRDMWLNLNGLWDFALTPVSQVELEPRSAAFDQKILVPFPVESALSGVMARVDDKRSWYRRTFSVPHTWKAQRVLLHFGAVDWDATVWLNGIRLGRHQGGYDAFSFDVTDALKGDTKQELIVSVRDPSDAGTQPRGKQVRRPEGIWYTPSSGIWQTVWLEPVPQTYLKGLKLEPDIDAGVLGVTADTAGAEGTYTAEVSVYDSKKRVAKVTGKVGKSLEVPIPDAKLWSPETPFLYDLEVRLLRNGNVIDRVTSYAGMRKFSLGKDDGGVTRFLLNNKPVFVFGLLDQGFWPDGLYTAPTDAALRFDLETAKKTGFNTVRKHVKVEPARWYYWADKLGLLVWQDMPSGDATMEPGEGELERTPASAEQFERELKRMVDTHANSPSLVMWVLFNEGWGQYDTVRLTKWLKTYDPTRLVNSVSGWNDQGVGDVQDVHHYPDPAAPPPDRERAAVLGEFGGLALPLPGLTWQDEANWGYQAYEDAAALGAAYSDLLSSVRDLNVTQGLAAAIYTQTTDVETEVNGLMTYDRKLVKLETPRLKYLAGDLYKPVPTLRVLSPTSETKAQWRYTISAPAEAWSEPGFDDAAWSQGPGGFGQADTSGAVVGTPWTARDLWLRRDFTSTGRYLDPYLRVYHDEDAEIYLNGQLLADLPYYTTEYVDIPLDEAQQAALKPGRNTLGVHCKRVAFGGFCDVGVYGFVEGKAE